MQAVVDEGTCIGCGLCEQTCPAVFEMVDGIAKVRVDPTPAGEEASCRDAAQACPVEAIAIVES